MADGANMSAHSIKTPWGQPSGDIIKGKVGDADVLFLSRHGAGHRLPPGDINYRANIDALKQMGATDLISISACGSLREELPPGAFVVVDQFIDRTTMREKTFFGDGFTAHVSMADPVCPALQKALVQTCAALDIPHKDGGVYLCMDGPQFSSRAESHMYRQWGCDVIGMTNMPEAKLAREAELPYATVAMVTDYDCWRESEKAVEVADVLAVMRENTARAEKLIVALAERLGPIRSPSPLGIETALDFAVITDAASRSDDMTLKLQTIAGRYLAAQSE
ncbi:MAG: S-methyl-5'-thioadenosine phosphorylase [Marinicaulis sp.]|nr:S-methyl-5'-thioadenosine phosphorylase [Marinicaulis sp.]